MSTVFCEAYTPRDLFNESKIGLELKGGTLSVDDTVLDKPYSHHMDLIGYFWSGKHHRVVKGINLITLYYTDVRGQHRPVNYRIYDKAEGKTKNDYFQDRLAEVLAWGLKPAVVTGDSGYSGLKNLKTVKNHSLGFLFALESHRLVSVDKGSWVQVQQLEIPAEGMEVWRRGFGQVKLFRTRLKETNGAMMRFTCRTAGRWPAWAVKPSSSCLISTGKLSNITGPSSRCAMLSIFRCVAKCLYGITLFPRFAVMSSCSECALWI